MCRRCGEPDRRGSPRDRKARKLWLLKTYGDGTTVACALQLSDKCLRTLSYATMQVDRLIPGHQGGSYRHGNIQPACGPCNIARTAVDYEVANDCQYG